MTENMGVGIEHQLITHYDYFLVYLSFECEECVVLACRDWLTVFILNYVFIPDLD